MHYTFERITALREAAKLMRAIDHIAGPGTHDYPHYIRVLEVLAEDLETLDDDEDDLGAARMREIEAHIQAGIPGIVLPDIDGLPVSDPRVHALREEA